MSTDPKTGKPHLEFFPVGEDGWMEIAPGAPHAPFRAGPQGCVLFENQFYL